MTILRSKTGKADATAKAAALGGSLRYYRARPTSEPVPVVVLDSDVADAIAAAGSAWICVASGDADALAPMLSEAP